MAPYHFGRRGLRSGAAVKAYRRRLLDHGNPSIFGRLESMLASVLSALLLQDSAVRERPQRTLAPLPHRLRASPAPSCAATPLPADALSALVRAGQHGRSDGLRRTRKPGLLS